MKRLVATVSGAVVVSSLVVLPGSPGNAATPGATRMVPASGTTSIRSTAAGPDVLAQPEFRRGPDDAAPPVAVNRPRPGTAGGGLFPPKPLPVPTVASSRVAGSNPEVAFSFEGLNHRDQRLANGGNQFSVEPPDQALCVGNGFTVEAVNSVLRVFSSANGTALTGVQDLNTFFGYPAAIDRTTFAFGPSVIDPVCLYDPDVQRFVVAITTLGSETNGAFTGKNTIDVAVSNTGDPTAAWTVYHIPAQNDGTDGTPDHHCTLDGVTPGPCFQDYPHIGADGNGVYITTNEYDLFGPSYNAAQIFAMSKQQLAAHPSSLPVTLVENLSLAGTPGWTVWPAQSPAGSYARAAGGTEYFLSTIAGDGSETGNPTGTARKIGLWALSNTRSLDSASPALRISSTAIDSQTYAFPPTAAQKPGPTPLRDCINDTTTQTVYGPGCWQLFFDPSSEPAHDEVQSQLDSGDSRMQQTWYVDGTLWGAAGTAVKVRGKVQAGIAWFAVDPRVNSFGKVSGEVDHQGYIALAGNNLTYPAIAMGANGRGVIAFTAVGSSYYPSAGYATIDDHGRVGPLHIAAAGAAPSDGFTSYKAFVGDPPRTRWGDYGAAVTDGKDLWVASEYIASSCTYQQYYPDPPSLTGFGSCDATRTSLANWSTRVTKLAG